MGFFRNRIQQEPVSGSGSTPERAPRNSKWWRRHHEKGSKPQIPSPSTPNAYVALNKTPSLWDKAYDALRIKDHQLVEEYESLLLKELSGDSSGSNTADEETSKQRERVPCATINGASLADPKLRQSQLDRIISNGLKQSEEKGKYRIVGHEFSIQEQIAKAAELLQWGKDWIDGAVQASPQASMAWAAVCVALPFLIKPAAAEQANRDGFTYVTTRIQYYAALESLLLPQSQGTLSEDLREKFEAHVVDLYKHILDFQIKSVLRFYRGALRKFGGDLIHGDDWKQMREKIEDLEEVIRQESLQINISSLREKLEDLVKSAEKSHATMQQFLAVIEQNLQVSKDHRDIAAESLSFQKQKYSKALSQEKEKCHQLFRLQKNGGDQSYEWYKDRVENRVEGTCHWFLNHDHFKQWLEQDSGPLLVSADPGCGKSVLAKYLVDHELPRSITICYFFFKDQIQNTLKQALCALLHQLFSAKNSLIRYAMPEYSKNGPSLVDVASILWNILCGAGSDPETGPVTFVLDALDECHESDLRDLVCMLKDRLRKEEGRPSKMKFLLTSRPYKQITSEFRELVDSFPYIHIPGEEESEIISQEINRVINYRVSQLARKEELDVDIKNHLEQRLLEIPHRTYLWVYLVFDELKQGFKKTKKGLGDHIKTLPESVNQAYDKILSRSTDQQKARKTLSIVLAAERPLTLREINLAVNVELSPRSRSNDDLDLEKEKDFKNTLRNWCGLFISIYGRKVYFLHQTAREFLIPRLSTSTSSPASSLSWCGSITLQLAQSIMADICITYLDFRDFEDETSIGHEDKAQINNHAFLEYSAENWGAHFRQAHFEDDVEPTPIVLRICNPGTKRFKTWFTIYWRSLYREDAPSDFTALIIASHFGFNRVVELLLTKGADANIRAKNGGTALHEAAWNGHETVVKQLLEKGADADIQNKYGETALYRAAANGHEAVVKQLLEGGADANFRDEGGETALRRAARYGHEGVVKQLLEWGADANIRAKDGWTALHRAATNGHEGVVMQLLEGRADANIRAEDGWTALHWAANGHEGVVKQLLEGGADANIRDKGGETALHWAARYGHEAVVKQLLEGGADANIRDEDGGTALHEAARNGHEAVVKILQN